MIDPRERRNNLDVKDSMFYNADPLERTRRSIIVNEYIEMNPALSL